MFLLKKRCLFFFLIFPLFTSCSHQLYKKPVAQVQKEYNISLTEMQLRDPFVLYDPVSKAYYMYANNKPGIIVYKSPDLKNWKDMGNAFTASADFWGKEDFWAPDAYYYNGKYYIFATFSDENSLRGTSILVSNYPDKNFIPLVNERITPKQWMALDGSLYIDKSNKPWLIFAREWLEVTDGQVLAQRLSSDLKTALGSPVKLFSASEASWVKAITSDAHNKTGMVTDAPYIHRTNDGQLIMLWSSFDKAGRYAIGVAHSASGNIFGPWTQSAQPINNDNGGHAMLFNTPDGDLMISYHAPNQHPEKPVLRKVAFTDKTIKFLN